MITLRRAAQSIPLMLLVSVLVFALLHAAPGGPLSVYLENPGVRPEDIERLRRALGLDQPLVTQYLRWLAAFVRGDWGFSLSDGRPVAERMLERAPATFELAATSLVVALLAAVPLGVRSSSAVKNRPISGRTSNRLQKLALTRPTPTASAAAPVPTMRFSSWKIAAVAEKARVWSRSSVYRR